MPFNGPDETIASVLRKLGIDPRERMDAFEQDAEYTACRSEEIPLYFSLYRRGTVDADERAVLCCFLLESLNERIQAGDPHPLQEEIFATLFDAGEIHAAELAYWMDTSDRDEENWWPITRPLLQHKAGRISGE
jgi:hypothetical protein